MASGERWQATVESPGGPVLLVRRGRMSRKNSVSLYSRAATALTTLLAPDVIFLRTKRFWTPVGVLQLSSALTLSAWSWPPVPQGKGPVAQDCPNLPLQMPVKVQVLECVSDQLRLPCLPSFSIKNTRAAYRIQENSLLTRLLICSQRC